MRDFKEIVVTIITFMLGFLGYQFLKGSGRIGVNDVIKKDIHDLSQLSTIDKARFSRELSGKGKR